MPMSSPQVALAVLVVAVGSMAPQAAAASCSGPRISNQTTEVAPGGRVTVVGHAFGDNCYDTGPPPEGEGVLGKPLDDIEIVFEQEGDEVVVARGAADESYGFTVEVTIPIGATPGPATLGTRGTSGDLQTYPPESTLTVTSETADPVGAGGVVTFGGSASGAGAAPPGAIAPEAGEPDTPGASATSDASDATGRNVAIGVGALAGLTAVVVAVLMTQRRRRRA